MKKCRKKVLSMFLAAAMTTAALTGCGAGGGKQTAPPADGTIGAKTEESTGTGDKTG